MKLGLSQVLPWAVALIAVVALGATAIVNAADSNVLAAGEGVGASADVGDPAPDYLYVVIADAGSLAAGENGALLLTLTGVATRGTYFSDRPERDAGSLAIDDLMAEIFVPDLSAPNAALVAGRDDDEFTLALTLTEPVYDAAAATLSFAVSPLEELPAGLSHLDADSDPDSAPSDFQPVELFIDSGHHTCTVIVENYSSYALELGSYSPTKTSSWRGGAPAEFINPGDTVEITYRYTNDSNQQHVAVTYRNAQKSDARPLDLTWVCRASKHVLSFNCSQQTSATPYYHCVLSAAGSEGRFTIVNSVVDTTVT